MIGKSVNYKQLVKQDFNTDDIISLMLEADSLSDQFINNDAVRLLGEDVEETCYNIWKFIKENIPYREDPDGWQYVQLPSSLFSKKYGDCKSYSLACAAILRKLGIDSSYTFISQRPDRDYHHVFLSVKNEKGKEIWLDCVDSKFNNKQKYARMKTISPKAKKSAIGSVKPVMVPADKNFSSYNIPAADSWKYQGLSVKKCWGTPVVMEIKVELYDWLNRETNNKHRTVYSNWGEFWLDKSKLISLAKSSQNAVMQEVKKDWESGLIWSIFEPISITLLLAKGEMKASEYWANMYDKRAFEQLLYAYWNNTQCIFPAHLAGKRQQAIDYKTQALKDKLNKRKTGLINTGDTYLNEARMRLACEKDCINLYDMPVNMMLSRAYALFNYGAGAVQFKGVPYWDKFHQTWVPNGTSFEAMSLVLLCQPYGKWQGSMPIKQGTPYWSNGGWAIRNGASDADYVQMLMNPKPKGCPEPLPYIISKKNNNSSNKPEMGVNPESNYILPEIKPEFAYDAAKYAGTGLTPIVTGKLADALRQLWQTPITWQGSGVKSVAWGQGMTEQWYWDGFAHRCRQWLGFFSEAEAPKVGGTNTYWFQINPTVILNWFKAVNIHPAVYMNNINGYQVHDLLLNPRVQASIGLFWQTIWRSDNFDPNYWEDNTKPAGILADFSTLGKTGVGATEEEERTPFDFRSNIDCTLFKYKAAFLYEVWSNFHYFKVMENGNPYEILPCKPGIGSIASTPLYGMNAIMQKQANKFLSKISGKYPGIGAPIPLAAILPAILSFIVALIGIIMKALSKDENSVRSNMTEPPTDLLNRNTVVPTADGGYSRPKVDANGNIILNPDGSVCWDKYDANDNLIGECIDINAPENRPATDLGRFGGLDDGTGKFPVLPLVFFAGGALLLFGGGGNKKGKKEK